MPRKRPAAPEAASSSRSRLTRRSTTTAPSAKRKNTQESEPDSDDEYETEPSASKKGRRGQLSSNRGRGGSKSKRSSFQAKQETNDDCGDEEQEVEENEESVHGEPSPETPSTSKKQSKSAPKKNKKKKHRRIHLLPHRTPLYLDHHLQLHQPQSLILYRKKDESLLLLPQLKKKERRERRKEREKEESMRQKYGSRKIKAEASKWNFGPISSINQRRREEMMAFFPKANFTSDNGVPKVMNNFRKATVKYNMEVLNPFITCSICDGYIVDATTIIDCMHTFCKSCLLTYFESDNKTCPTCGTFIHGSHPTHYVTYDRAVNELVNQFVPKLEKIEMDTRKKFLRDCREALGIDTAAEDRERKERLERERITGTNRCYPLEKPRLSHHRDDCQVTVKLLPGTSNLPLVTRPFVRCSEMTTMNTLRKFISLQIWDDQSRYSDLDMFCDDQLMGKDFSIRFVWMMKRRGQPKSVPLVIRYHMARS
uniref:RING-type domain-containing protein n=1 Tax=Caenorhabditis tropicalis TaxID=1561998 RepID=A0A1I7T0M7_9PELO